MNLIVIMLDSLRQDHVSFYNKGKEVFDGIKPCKTPNIDQFAKECIVFENVYPEGLPTIPVRTELMTGQGTLAFRPWEPLGARDITVAEILRKENYVCGLVSDTYHYRAPGMNFHKGFHSYNWIRGQEYDPWISSPSHRKIEDYVNLHYTEHWKKLIHQFLANTDDFKKEEDWFSAKVVNSAIEWLKKNRVHKNIFLWMDSFDPHEPWDPPHRFDTYTDKNYSGKRLIMPMGYDVKEWATEEEIKYIRGLYAGEVSSVDYWVGKLFKELKRFGYYDDSVIVLLADHGHPLAEHGKFLKGGGRLYSELLKLPFMIRFPKGKYGGKIKKALIQFPDVLPTLLEIIGLKNNSYSMHGKSFAELIKGNKDKHREAAIVGYHEAKERAIRDQHWSYIQRGEGEYDELYNLDKDPVEKNNLIDKYPEEAKRLFMLFGNVYRKSSSAVIKGIQQKYELSASL